MKRWIKEQKVNIILCLVILIGVGLLSYPTVSDWWNRFHQTRAVASYAAAVSQMKTEDYDRLFAEADDYNRKLAGTGMKWSMTDEEIQEYNRSVIWPVHPFLSAVILRTVLFRDTAGCLRPGFLRIWTG